VIAKKLLERELSLFEFGQKRVLATGRYGA